MPYDIYRPNAEKKRTQIEIYRKDESLVEAFYSITNCPLLSGTIHGMTADLFPKEMLVDTGIFAEQNATFA